MRTVRSHQLSNSALQELLGAGLTYPEVNATRGEMPSGYHHLERSAFVGVGAASFDAVSRLVMRWEMHRRAGLAVSASHTPLVEGTVAVLRLGVGVLAMRAPVRVVRVIDEPWRAGFVYGTLPGHPEQGEESFVVTHHSDNQVILTVKAFSRPSSRLARIGGPITRLVQSWITRRYLLSAAEHGLKFGNPRPPRRWILDRTDDRTIALVEGFIGFAAVAMAVSQLLLDDLRTAALTGAVAATSFLGMAYSLFRVHRSRSQPKL